MASDGMTGYPHQTIPLHPHVPSSTSFHNDQTYTASLSLSLPSPSPTVVATAVSKPHN